MNLISTLIKIVHCFLIKIVHCFLYKQFLRFCIKLFFVQHYLRNCSLSFLHKLFSVHCFLIKHLVKSCFLNLNAKSKCFFMFIYKICFYINKIFSLHIIFVVYSNLLTAFIKFVFCIK